MTGLPVTPMLGFRGARLEIRYPEIAEMQARAIFEGAVEAGRKTGQPGSWPRSSSAAPSSTW
jgi:phosphoenolpyruvate synthase/pyruvate phosphate dikinase